MSNKETAALRLRRAKASIIADWEARVGRDFPCVPRLHDRQLRSYLLNIIDVLIERLSLATDQSPDLLSDKLMEASANLTRLQAQECPLNHVINELYLLQRLAILTLDPGGLTPFERDIILDAFAAAVGQVATRFVQQREQEASAARDRLGQQNSALESSLGEKAREARINGQLLKSILERVEDYAIFSLDAQGLITSWSEGCEKIIRHSAAEAIGQPLGLLYPPEGRARGEPQSHLETAASQGRFRGEGLRMRKDGELYLADVFITPMYEDQRLLGYFKIMSDLSTRDQIIQEIDLTRRQVKALTAENELRDRFVCLITHDLRTPLAVAKLSAELITRLRCDDPNHSALARKCVNHICRADDLIGNLLDVSRINEKSAFPLKITQFELTQLARDVCSELTLLWGDRIKVEAPELIVGFWDQTGMKRLLENLLSNAAKYGAADGEVTVSLAKTQNRVLMTVHNFGSMIAPEEQQRLFEPYHRAPSAEAGANVGWGLGLTLVRGITEAHGGMIKLRSLVDEGTTFIIDLPIDVRTFSSVA